LSIFQIVYFSQEFDDSFLSQRNYFTLIYERKDIFFSV
jgi:hypothetical protein